MRASREAATPDLQPRPSVSSSLARLSLPAIKTSSGVQSSATWTSTTGDLGGLSDTDKISDRETFVEEYNRIAKKYGVRALVPDNDNLESIGVLPKRGWFSRTFRRTSSQSTEHSVRRQRSVGHVAAHLANLKRDSLKDQDIQGLVRLCGKSFLYLPPEYAPGSLILPTCFRATAQYLVQHAPETRGVFRIPGSVRVVNELYEFYCADQARGDVANTVRSPNLPSHVSAGVHDVASCFKKFLAGIPGGILGSLSLFDALVAINSQLYCEPEFSRTKQSKIRARLIALAVSTLRSQFRRELICAVFGLLCMLGRAAETAPREDEHGRPLPTSDLMGYNALGIVFGPLLLGDMLGSHAVKLADPCSGLFIVPVPPSPKSKKEKKKAKEAAEEPHQPFLNVDKIHVANDITEMLVANWRDVVKQMRNLEGDLTILRRRSHTSFSKNELRRSSSFRDSSHSDVPMPKRSVDRQKSYVYDLPASPGSTCHRTISFNKQLDSTNDALSIKKTRPSATRPVSSQHSSAKTLGVLSPPMEESVVDDEPTSPIRMPTPLRSSMKFSKKNVTEPVAEGSPETNENTSPCGDKKHFPCGSLPRTPGSHYSMKRPAEILSNQGSSSLASPNRNQEHKIAETLHEQCYGATATSRSSKWPTTPKSLTQIDGSPKRPQPSCDLDPVTEYRAGPGVRILQAPSTVRTQPKVSHVDPHITPAKMRSCVQKTSPRATATLGDMGDDDEAHPARRPSTRSSRHRAAPDQIDGAVDFQPTVSCHGTTLSYGGEFERQANAAHLQPSLPISKSRPHAVLAKISGPSKRSSDTILRKLSPKVATDGRNNVIVGASKVKGLAAMFDSAARASPLVPTPGGAIQKKRRETARVISPYTSNPSPRASVQSVASVSTPVSLMSPSRISITLSSVPAEFSSRKSMIPRPQTQTPSRTGSANKIETSFDQQTAQREDSSISASSYVPSRLPSPSRPPVTKTVSSASPAALPQLDGSTKASKMAFKLTAQQEFHPVCYSSSPIPHSKTIDDIRKLPRLSRSSHTSGLSEPVGHSAELSPLSASPSFRGRSASSLRDQIRSLRIELSAKNEDYTQVLLALEQSRKTKEVNEILLRHDINRAREDMVKWRRRAELAERKADKFESLAMRIKDARDLEIPRQISKSAELGAAADDHLFLSGSDYIDTAEQSSAPLPLTARMNQSVRRTHPTHGARVNTVASGAGDTGSVCSGSTVVRNVASGPEDESVVEGSRLGDLVDELSGFASSGWVDNRL